MNAFFNCLCVHSALMTPEQKEAYIAQKREELRKALKKKRAALNKVAGSNINVINPVNHYRTKQY